MLVVLRVQPRRAARQGLHQLRARPLPLRPLRRAAAGLRPGRRARAHASTRSSTTSTSATSSSCSCSSSRTRMADFGLEDRLYRYASRPDVIYSDLNGYGHFLPAVMWFRLYWGAFAVLLLVLVVRAVGARARRRPARPAAHGGRAHDARRRGRSPASRPRRSSAPARGSTTTRTSSTRTSRARRRSACGRLREDVQAARRRAAAEDHGRRRQAPTSIPTEQRARITGTLSLVNANAQPVTDVYVLYPRAARDAQDRRSACRPRS